MNASLSKNISDFSDRLNPMLVKELRQGLRGISFVALFIALQAFLALILLTTASSSSYENTGHMLSRVIFFLFSCAVLIIQPLRGMTALSSEIKGNTIDLLCLTGLNSWKIVYGKWVSLMSQSALILTSIVPYLILRYFFGDMRLLSELLLLFTLFTLSAMFTALTVGFSALPSVILRILLPLGGAFLALALIINCFADSKWQYQAIIELISLQTMEHWLTYLGLLMASFYGTWLCLDLGASIIAPVAENRATFKRILSLVTITTTMVILTLSNIDKPVAFFIIMALVSPICFLSLTENPHLALPVTTPFINKGFLGKILGRLLYPGWATGLLYVGIVYILTLITLELQPNTYVRYFNKIDTQMIILTNAVFASLLMALVMMQIFARKTTNRMGVFILFLLIQVITFSALAICEVITRDLQVLELFFWLPATALALLDDSHRMEMGTLLFVSSFNVVVYFLIALIMSRPIWSHIASVEKEAQQANQLANEQANTSA